MEELEGVPQGCPRPYLWAQEPEPAYQRCLHHRVEIFLTIVVGFFEVCGVLNAIHFLFGLFVSVTTLIFHHKPT